MFQVSHCPSFLHVFRKCPRSYCPTFYRLQLASVKFSYFLHVPIRKCSIVLLFTGCSLQVFYCSTFYTFQEGSVLLSYFLQVATCKCPTLLSYFLHAPSVLLSYFLQVTTCKCPIVLLFTYSCLESLENILINKKRLLKLVTSYLQNFQLFRFL